MELYPFDISKITDEQFLRVHDLFLESFTPAYAKVIMERSLNYSIFRQEEGDYCEDELFYIEIQCTSEINTAGPRGLGLSLLDDGRIILYFENIDDDGNIDHSDMQNCPLPYTVAEYLKQVLC